MAHSRHRTNIRGPVFINSMTNTYWTRNFVRICVGNMLIFLAFQMLLPTLPVYLSHHGSTETMIGLTTAIITFAAVVIRLFIGQALDRYDGRPIVIGSTVVIAVAAVGYSVSPSPAWIVMTSFVFGAAWGVVTVAYATIVAGLIPQGQHGAGIGTFFMFALASMAAGPFFGGWLFDAHGQGALFGAACAVALLSLVLFLARAAGSVDARTDAAPGAKLVTGDAGADAHPNAGIDAEGEGSTRWPSTGRPSRPAVFETSALFPSALVLLFMFSFGGIVSFAALYGQELGLRNGGLFLLLSNIAAVAVRPVAGRLFDTRGPAYVILPGAIIGVTALFMLSSASGASMFLVAAAVYGLAFGAVQPYSQAWAVQRANPARQGAANSTFLIGVDVGITLGSMTLGFWTEAWGYAGIFRIAAFVVIAQIVIYGASLFRSQRAAVHDRPEPM